MKRFFAAVLFVGLMVFFCACGQKPAASPTLTPQPFKTADELISEAQSREQQTKSASQAQELVDVAGEYICPLADVDEAFWPSLTLDAKGEGVFRANLLTGMGEIEGSYTATKQAVKFAVSKVKFNGFNGDKVTDIVFDLLPEGGLKLAYVNPDTAIGITNAGDLFQKKADEE